MNPVIQNETILNGEHYVVELMGAERRAFCLNQDDVYGRRDRLAQNFCLILFDRSSDDYFVVPFQVLANVLSDRYLSTSRPPGVPRGWTGSIVEDKTMRFDKGEQVEICSCYDNARLLKWLIAGHDVFSFRNIDIDEEAEGWPTYCPFDGQEDENSLEMEDTRRDILKYVKARPGQAEFRAALCARYGKACMVTACSIDGLVEAAHIVPYRVNADHNPSNGLLLSADIHTLFDLHLLGIEPELLEISIHPDAEREGYGYLKGRTLRLPNQLCPSSRALEVRWNWFNDRLGSSSDL